MSTTDNFAAHKATYDAVLRLFKLSVPAITVITAFVVYLLAH